MNIVCADLEGVFIPEIWVNVAKKTGIEELKMTTRDEPDYDKLMKMRLEIIEKNGLTIKDIQDVIETMEPLPGAKEFLDWLREENQLIILSVTFMEFGMPFMRKLRLPTLFCHELEISGEGKITDYKLRMPNHKKEAVQRFKELNYQVIAFGDSYNDTNMLKIADIGFLFMPPQNVIDEFPQFPVANNYEELKVLVSEALKGLNLSHINN
jgi:phosphoserine/homoserine phosphotransferase